VSRTETIYGVSPGAFEYGDILAKPKQAGRAMNFFWQHTPQVSDQKHSKSPQPGSCHVEDSSVNNCSMQKPVHRSPPCTCK
jgi:hypothetical protein